MNDTMRWPATGCSWVVAQPLPDRHPVTVDTLLTEAVRGGADRPAVQGGTATMTFRAWDDVASSVARALRTAAPGRGVVGLLADLSPVFPAYYYGVIRSGNVVAPINPLLPAPAVAHVLRLAMPSAVLVTHEGLDALRAKLSRQGLADLIQDELPIDHGALLRLRTGARPELPDDTAALMFTSGSTGRAKAVAYSHRNVLANAEQLMAAHDITAAGALAHSRPIFYPMHMNASVLAGARQVLAGQARVLDSVLAAEATAATHLYSLPVRLEQLAADPAFGSVRVRHLRMIGSGSTALSAKAAVRIGSTLDIPCWQGYGLSETTSLVSTERTGYQRIGSVGAPVRGVAVRIAGLDDAAAEPVPVGTAGQVWVAGPNIMQGYLDGSGVAAPAPDWFPTGDYGTVSADGLLTVIDRVGDLVRSGDEVVSPSSVRRGLEAHPEVAECAVVGVPAADGTPVRLAGFVRTTTGSAATPDLPTTDLDSLTVLESLPRLPNGKVDQAALVALAQHKRPPA
ncbi:MAG TPA: class I adenylate-forming enzyme family protein [Actinophytocola sp.]|uniref:class I adenylate-forming enzyme family protein n=1 Tax=Actinophytocola sp. TaxID=1872138 RepID=UPI002DC02FEB|nr:class I adenylate-forming enzyme family protein [Actinophytocola sp.]HEU5473628.1 class I adenylate-forming enzyme family protein [Actinophytocola sp.]